jgi:thiol-disulfide isomerase/thioredoxin
MIRRVALVLILSLSAFAGIIEDVRGALAQNNFTAAEAELKVYKTKLGVTPEYLEAFSWMARSALSMEQYSQAESYAKQTMASSTPLLKMRKLDRDPHLATAIGAALEVQALSLAGRGEKAAGIALLRKSLGTYGNTSIAPRLHKNLNLLTFVGQPAPPLRAGEFLGTRPPSFAELKGTPLLLFFWAHWCGDCKGESAILAKLRSEFKELKIIAPTQRYGYAARGEDATPQAELAYINTVWQQYYSGLQGVPVPLSKENFNVYGSSTTPTLVLVDRDGKIAYYHPGAVSYEELRGAIEKVVRG